MKQYYSIEIESSLYYDDTEKLIFNSFKELKDYVKSKIEYLLKYYPITKEQKEKYKIKKVYKRIEKLGIYEDKNSLLVDYKNPDPQSYKTKGVVFQVNYKDKLGDYEYLLEYFCFRVTKKDMYKFSGFKEANK